MAKRSLGAKAKPNPYAHPGEAKRGAKSVTPGSVPEKTVELLTELVQPHVESFNFCCGDGLRHAVDDLRCNPEELYVPDGTPRGALVRFWVDAARIDEGPFRPETKNSRGDRAIYPAECRERGLNYTAKLNVTYCFQVNGGEF